METTYNWYSNKSTYLFNLYFNPQTVEELYGLQFVLEESKNEIECPFIRNLVSLANINYQELEETILEDNIN